MPEYTLEDFQDVICLRNQLLNAPLQTLMDEYQDYNQYVTFINSVITFSNIDSGFLLFDDNLIDKISRIIQIYRFENPPQDVRDAINSIILYLNRVKAYPKEYKELLKSGYREYQEDTRKVSFETDADMLYSLGYDGIVLMALQQEQYEDLQVDMFLASINYFLETMPELFQVDRVRKRVLEEVGKLDSWSSPKMIRQFAKATKEEFQKIKQKEE